MVKTSDQLKNMVEDWIKVTGVKYQDTTQKANNEEIQWQFLIGTSVTITKLKSRDDRINIDSGARISETHQTGFNGLTNKAKNDLIGNINEISILSGVKCIWDFKDNQILSFNIADYIDVEELDRPSFMKTWDKVNNISGHTVGKINHALNPEANPTASPKDGSSDSSIYG